MIKSLIPVMFIMAIILILAITIFVIEVVQNNNPFGLFMLAPIISCMALILLIICVVLDEKKGI